MRNKIVKINSFILLTGLFYILQNISLGQISFFENTFILKPVLLKEILFLITSLLLSLSLFKWNFSDNS